MKQVATFHYTSSLLNVHLVINAHILRLSICAITQRNSELVLCQLTF